MLPDRFFPHTRPVRDVQSTQAHPTSAEVAWRAEDLFCFPRRHVARTRPTWVGRLPSAKPKSRFSTPQAQPRSHTYRSRMHAPPADLSAIALLLVPAAPSADERTAAPATNSARRPGPPRNGLRTSGNMSLHFTASRWPKNASNQRSSPKSRFSLLRAPGRTARAPEGAATVLVANWWTEAVWRRGRRPDTENVWRGAPILPPMMSGKGGPE